MLGHVRGALMIIQPHPLQEGLLLRLLAGHAPSRTHVQVKMVLYEWPVLWQRHLQCSLNIQYTVSTCPCERKYALADKQGHHVKDSEPLQNLRERWTLPLQIREKPLTSSVPEALTKARNLEIR